MAWAWARPAEVEPCLAATTGGECAVRMSGGVARLCGAVAPMILWPMMVTLIVEVEIDT